MFGNMQKLKILKIHNPGFRFCHGTSFLHPSPSPPTKISYDFYFVHEIFTSLDGWMDWDASVIDSCVWQMIYTICTTDVQNMEVLHNLNYIIYTYFEHVHV
jgi:hypothetical protein